MIEEVLVDGGQQWAFDFYNLESENENNRVVPVPISENLDPMIQIQ